MIHPGTFPKVPGNDSGTKESLAKRPALPFEQPSPGGARSTTTTSWPSLRR